MKYLKLGLMVGLIISGLLPSCEKDKYNACEEQVIVSTEQYNNAPDDNLTINSLEINGNCLKIDFNSGGCDGKSWEMKLIDSEAIMESNPPQRNVRLSLKNEELCEAYINKVVTFDISALKVDGVNKVKLNIINSGEQILYEY